WQAMPHGEDLSALVLQLRRPALGERERPLRATPALGRGITDGRLHELLFLQPAQREVGRRLIDRATCALLDEIGHGDAVRFLSEMSDCQKDEVLELAQRAVPHATLL